MIPPLRVGILAQWGIEGWSGGVNYLRHILMGAASLAPRIRPHITLFIEAHQIAAIKMYESVLPLADAVVSYAGQRLNETTYHILSADTLFADIDVLYPCTAGWTPPKHIPAVYWIPDFQHCQLPHFFTSQERRQRDASFKWIAEHARLLVFSSNAAKADFQRFFPNQDTPDFVMPFCSVGEKTWFNSDADAVRVHYRLPERYLMCCNQFWAHKDHLILLRALAALRRKSVMLPLVCTGSTEDYRNPDYFATLQQAVEHLDLSEQVHILGLLDREHQIQLLRRADAIIQPSLFEGWSTVVEDARALGKTIVYSDIPVHLEQNPPHGFPFKAGQATDLARAIQDAQEQMLPTAGTCRETQAREDGMHRLLAFGLSFVHMCRKASGV